MVRLDGREIGLGAPCFIIAEAGVNHNGSLERALEMVEAAAAAGADSIKFQTFRSEALVTAAAPKAAYQSANTGLEGSQLQMLNALELSHEAFVKIRARCQEKGILFLSTPFESESARFLYSLDISAFKLGSGELTNIPFLREVAGFGKPLIVSTGMGTESEVAEAVEAVRSAGDPPLFLLHCVSSYPAPHAEYNLRPMDTMETAFKVPVGLSDHTMGWEVTLAAVALGARIIEKHFTLDRGLPGPDHAASLEPRELAEMIRQIRLVESALGDGVKRPSPSELSTRDVARKSVVLLRAKEAGSVLEREDLAVKRPGHGIPPSALDRLPGRRLKYRLEADSVLSWEDVEA